MVSVVVSAAVTVQEPESKYAVTVTVPPDNDGVAVEKPKLPPPSVLLN